MTVGFTSMQEHRLPGSRRDSWLTEPWREMRPTWNLIDQRGISMWVQRPAVTMGGGKGWLLNLCPVPSEGTPVELWGLTWEVRVLCDSDGGVCRKTGWHLVSCRAHEDTCLWQSRAWLLTWAVWALGGDRLNLICLFCEPKRSNDFFANSKCVYFYQIKWESLSTV